MKLLLIFKVLIILSSFIPLYVDCVKCYICEFNAAFCKGVSCYNNPDLCSTNQFSTALVPVAHCPRNCQLQAVTNPTGLVIRWSRFCAPANDHTKGFKCRTDYKIGSRIDQCICDKDFCNNSNELQIKAIVLLFCLLFSFLII